MEAIIECAGIEEEELGVFEEIKRERSTENRKRIDLCISYENYIIGIENKIKAGLYNDLKEYDSYLQERAQEQKSEDEKSEEESKKHKLILLSLHDDFSREDQIRIKDANAKVILYEDLIETIEKNIGGYLFAMPADMSLLLKHFILNIKNWLLKKEEKMLESEDYKYLLENEERIGKAHGEIGNLRAHIIDEFGKGLNTRLRGKYGNRVNRDRSFKYPAKDPFEHNIAIRYEALGNKEYRYIYIHISLWLEQDGEIKDEVCITFRRRKQKGIEKYGLDHLRNYGLKRHNSCWYIGDGFRKKIDCERYDYKSFIDKAVESASELVDRFSRSLKQSKSY